MYRDPSDVLYTAIKSTVQAEPGIQLVSLAEKLGVDKSTVGYRLRNMERLGIVKLQRGRQFLAVYPVVSN